MITYEQLVEHFHYDKMTGVFTWKKRYPGTFVGQLAGFNNIRTKYRYIRFHKKCYKASRLAFLYMTGAWPDGEIDHINRIPTDDRWSNLRDATHSQNMVNAERKNKTGFRGVYFHAFSKLYRSEIKVNGKKISLGYHDTPEEAHHAYRQASIKYHQEFSIYNG